MSDNASTPTGMQKLNLFALLLALAVLTATGLAWWRDRAHRFETPRWEAARFVPLTGEIPIEGRERWMVAVNLTCSHCQEHLRAVAARTAARAHPPSLGALIVDQPTRPTAFDLQVALPAGAWWDSANVWREAWGRRAYGETFRFGANGELLSSTSAGVVPDSAEVIL